MKKNQIHVSIDSMSYWWGIYGLTKKVGWEDITMYNKIDQNYIKVARACICTKSYLESSLEELEEDLNQKDFVNEIKEFLNKNEVEFQYEYDNPDHDDFYEVPFEAERNDKGIKPCYIEIWNNKISIDEDVVRESVVLFCKRFLNLSVDEVIFKDVVSIEEATIEFLKQCERFNDGIKVLFSDELIKNLEKEWKKPREKVLEILNRSMK